MSVASLIPPAVLTQHIAVLGKTGSGKTSTAKLLIEQVVADGARVCILDPIKSDWWGLTSSANGKEPGLPFHILGGPRGHVPLHADAGKAIGEIVASGALPLSILDMADFEPGGQAKFFVDFAPTLLRKMRGVVYLVIEEAHLFAPKERSGVGKENLSIHWAKTLATAGRSKGVRLVLVTQRTQALHNALLGSCDTLIAHRLTAPADQDPIVKWLKANTTKEILEKVSTSLASLKTGHGWVCSGEAKLFELVHFPRISTYDNTATPTGDGADQVVKTAAVDQEKLRAIIGDAVKDAEANDPKLLQRQLADLRQQLAKKDAVLAAVDEQSKRIEDRVDSAAASSAEVQRRLAQARQLEAQMRALLEDAMKFIVTVNAQNFSADGVVDQDALNAAVSAAVQKVAAEIQRKVETQVDEFNRLKTSASRLQEQIKTLLNADVVVDVTVERQDPYRVVPDARQPPRPVRTASSSGVADDSLGKGERIILIAIAQHPAGASREQLTVQTGYKKSSRDTYLQKLQQRGLIESEGGQLVATQAGVDALGANFERLPTGARLLAYHRETLPTGERVTLDAIVKAYPKAIHRDHVTTATNYKKSSRDTYLQKLMARRLIEAVGRGEVRASKQLFGL